MKALFEGSGIHIHSLNDKGLHHLEIEESGSTYQENASIKAVMVGDQAKQPVIADDSGIEVMALGGKPGLYSARYGKGSDHDRCLKLLSELEGKEDRCARFVCWVVYYDHAMGEKHAFEGVCNGIIAASVMGEHGFGYDPVFIPEGYHETMATLSPSIKNEISHRARAVQALRKWLDERNLAQS